MMGKDELCEQRVISLIQKFGEYLFPEERNVSVVIGKVGELLGLEVGKRKGLGKIHLPTPEETGPFFDCPKCGGKGLVIYGLCSTCKDAEGGKFQSKLVCKLCAYETKSRKHVVSLLQEFGFEFRSATKKEIGIKTITDEGVK